MRVYTPTHTIPNKSHLGEGLRVLSIEGTATLFLAGTARLCLGCLISHPRQMGGFCRPEFLPHYPRNIYIWERERERERKRERERERETVIPFSEKAFLPSSPSPHQKQESQTPHYLPCCILNPPAGRISLVCFTSLIPSFMNILLSPLKSTFTSCFDNKFTPRC